MAASNDHGPVARRSTSLIKNAVVTLNLLVVAFLSIALMGVTRRVNVSETEKTSLETELARTREDVERITKKNDEQLVEVIRRESAGRDEHQKRDEERLDQIAALASRLEKIENQNRQNRVEVTTNFKRDIEDLRSTFMHSLDVKKDAPTMFRDFEKTYGRGVVLIYTEFDYVRIRDGKEGRAKTVTGWGSGFFVSDEGHIVTSKHVVQPWKFDQDIATMISLGEIKVDETTLRIAAWESGTEALDGEDHPRLTVGYNNSEKKNLRLYAVAPDHMSEQSLDGGVFGPKYKLHDLDNNDLAILKAEGKNFCPLPSVEAATPDRVTKLDPVMALGYPRGQNGLETSMVTTSPSIGTVRKAENTIHVTASIIPGNSGGPLIGPTGEVVGIVTRIYSETLGICIKMEHAWTLLEAGRAAEDAENALANVLPLLGARLILSN